MNTMFVSPWLLVSPEGPTTCAAEGSGLVHMRQGDADGACGPYALMMGLITLGALEREDVANMGSSDGRSRVGRFRNALLEHGALISQGTSTEDLINLSWHFRAEGIAPELVKGNKRELVTAIQEAIENHAVPLLSVSWSKLEGHWLMVVGHQGYELEGVYQPTHLLCLDPASEAPKASLWNAVIAVHDDEGKALRSGTYTCDHWGLDGQVSSCKLDQVLMLTH
ncbi:hypothetical protein ASF84_21480 [Pseudomonas sp. Leaf127]|uniref:hypothetical protein n=1 Tax=Pseudomonas sp. Leaf127 TaxID=1736267 RepID=UPI000702D05D|nr:hypothetical protein [Pseudomonas sp. Leaf127]KQQ50839.1 hypothetical protein ASF84_21480 [Pseudomonas sp. Leaf127]